MTIAERIIRVEADIVRLETDYHRVPGSITLLAVSKTQPPNAIREAYAAGLRHFGENYWQEAEQKIQALHDLAIHWHFIGAIQSNKAAAIARQVEWVHSLDREKTARLLALHRPASMPPLNICIQVNLDDETSKSGVKPDEILPLAQLITELPGLQLRGLMAIPLPRPDKTGQYQSLQRLKQLLDRVNEKTGLALDTLSMGMTDDLAAAIRAGSTIVRIGRAIFGDRL
ncbi:YggS family pyridoxal phosphate-dependent enzyme [Legionella birminghamensis]|nr:YggS family pyridoxal phosphate-dependent enzyme [Legionella birminghamensis]